MSKEIELSRLQHEVNEWSQRNFPNGKPYHPLLGASEEIGELCHAHLKHEQGIRGTPEDHHEAKIDAVADAVIYLADYCARNGINMGKAVSDTWEKVRERDWQKNRANGLSAIQPNGAVQHT